ncbi:MAG: response regulator [Anaerolineae bacterium]
MGTSRKVIFVDDEPNVLAGYVRQFRKRFEVDTVSSGEAGLRALEDHGPYAVVVSDMRMLGMSGMEFLSKVKELAPDTVRILFTGYADLEIATQAINEVGVFRFLAKPCRADTVLEAIQSGLQYHKLLSTENAILAVSGEMPGKRQLIQRFLQDQRMETLGRLGGTIAHDFNNLLTGIRGHASFALDALPAESVARGDVREVIRIADRAASLARQLLAFSRGQSFEPRLLNLNDLVADTSKMLRRLVGEEVEIATALDPSLSLARLDPGQLEQVLVNLAINARDAMPTGGRITIETSNGLLEEPGPELDAATGNCVVLAVSDTGVGMSESVRSRVFEPFFTTKEPGKGTGLGLATVYGIVKQHRGRIDVASQVGQGTVFRIHLPAASAADGRATEYGAGTGAVDVATPQILSQGKETVLLAEDECTVRRVIALALRRLGYGVLEAANGREALELARTCADPIDLLITDVIMPKMDGKDLAAAFGNTYPHAGILFVSGYTGESVQPEDLQQRHRGSAYLQKPFTIEILSRRVREAIDAKRERAG